MQQQCTRCQAAIQRTDVYCHSCGSRVDIAGLTVDDDFVPVPGVVGQPDMRIPRKRRSRRSGAWRRVLLVGGSVIAIALAGAGGAGILDAADVIDIKSPISRDSDVAVSWAQLTGSDFHPAAQAHMLARHAIDMTRDS